MPTFTIIPVPPGLFKVRNVETGTESITLNEISAHRVLRALRAAPPLETGSVETLRLAARSRLRVVK